MNQPILISLVLDAFDDLERSVEGLKAPESETRLTRFSSISWTVAHLAQTIDIWLVNRVANQPINDFLSDAKFAKGSSGEGVEWNTVCAALKRTLDKSRALLGKINPEDLEKETLYQGTIGYLKGKPVAKEYWIARRVAHIYYHIGEITTIRSTFSESVADFPGNLAATHSAKTNK